MFVYQRIVWRFQLQTMSINTKKSARYVTRLDNSWRGSGSVEFAVLHTERRADRGYITLATFVGHLRQNLFNLAEIFVLPPDISDMRCRDCVPRRR